MRLLDVGAISGTSYTKFPWIETTSIDLNPRDPSVLKYDFFDFPIPKTEEEKYDCVGLSLVINFIGDLKRRGMFGWFIGLLAQTVTTLSLI
jgi:25S rRNA (adenine2142-N1)-methyltransferase